MLIVDPLDPLVIIIIVDTLLIMLKLLPKDYAYSGYSITLLARSVNVIHCYGSIFIILF